MASPAELKAFSEAISAGRYDTAAAIAQALATAPAEPRRGQWWAQAGMAWLLGGQHGPAHAAYAQAQTFGPLSADHLYNWGLCCDALGLDDEAVTHYRSAVQQAPQRADIHNNLGKILNRLGCLDEAELALRTALKLEPGRPKSQLNLAFNLLMRGDWAAAWPLFEARHQVFDTIPPMPYPAWNGRPQANRLLLLRAEQGLGDAIQFARLATLLGRAGQPVVVQVAGRLQALLKTLPAVAGVVRSDQTVSSAQHPVDWAPLLSLPGLMGLTPATVPWPGPYLAAEPERVARWRQWLPAEGLRIGIGWQGNPQGDVDRGRSMPLHWFGGLAALPGVRLVALQQGWGREQIAQVPFGNAVAVPGEDFDAGDNAFLDSAALMASLDLVITSDTALAHLAGALGRPVWLALQRWPDWRWSLDGERSAWYPTMRLFRQTSAGDWAGVFARITQAALALPR